MYKYLSLSNCITNKKNPTALTNQYGKKSFCTVHENSLMLNCSTSTVQWMTEQDAHMNIIQLSGMEHKYASAIWKVPHDAHMQQSRTLIHPFFLLIVVDHFYTALFPALTHSHCTRMWFYMSEQLFIAQFWLSTKVVYLQRWHGWCHMQLLPPQRALCTPYNHAPCHFMQSHICKLYAYLAVTCYPHFWQNDQGLLHATVVSQGWNGYQN